jgi:hypothetical protein
MKRADRCHARLTGARYHLFQLGLPLHGIDLLNWCHAGQSRGPSRRHEPRNYESQNSKTQGEPEHLKKALAVQGLSALALLWRQFDGYWLE